MRSTIICFSVMCAALAGCEPKVASIEVAPAKVTFSSAAETKTLVVTIKDSDGNPIEGARPVTWAIADQNVARVDEKGNVKAAGTGTTTVTATVEEQSAKATVEVVILKQIQLQSIALVVVAGTSSEPIRMNFMNERGEPLSPDFDKQPAWKPTWRSGNDAIATVNGDGVITGVSAGTTVITATVGELKAELTLTVNPPPDAPPPTGETPPSPESTPPPPTTTPTRQ
jgi:uncharacterized protein YjdB